MEHAVEERVLLVEADPAYRVLVHTQLQNAGYHVVDTAQGRSALDQLIQHEPDLVVLGGDLPDMRGVELCRAIRQWSSVPIVALSVHPEEARLVAAFEAGVDDYLVKPHSATELVLRVRSLIRRSHGLVSTGPELICGDLRLSVRTRRVVVRGQSIRLTPIEWRLLRELVAHCGEVLAHDELLGRVWGLDHVRDQAYLRVYIRRLRQYIEPVPEHPQYLLSQTGVGYVLYATPPAPADGAQAPSVARPSGSRDAPIP